MLSLHSDSLSLSSIAETIAAPATPPGRGGVGVVRVSGPLVKKIAEVILKKNPKPREALFSSFKNLNGELLDEGLALFFPAPNSFTGEDVLELQGHGGPVVMNRLMTAILELGARVAEPGEFSLRAFLNHKMDLVQAEAVADLIDASSERAAKLAISSLSGVFSEKIHGLVDALIQLRMYVEAAIDFPEEEIDFLEEGRVADKVKNLLDQLKQILKEAHQGVLIKEGLKLVILGKPNAGKSSLLNALAGEERAIVTDIPGTTRDIVREYIHIEGVPFHILDTAGLREASDIVEAEGIRRALKAAREADRLLVVMDATDATAKADLLNAYAEIFALGIPVTWVMNKSDLLESFPPFLLPETEFQKAVSPSRGETKNPKPDPELDSSPDTRMICSERDQSSEDQKDQKEGLFISAKTGIGLDALRKHLLAALGLESSQEGIFLARTRHLDALKKAEQHLEAGFSRIIHDRAGELLAEELKETQNALGLITGEFRADDLLGVIFSKFCIGK
jgi:tRNA modification GTPase